MTVRPATHAGSWYIGNRLRLDKQMDQMLEHASAATHAAMSGISPDASSPAETPFPVPGSRFLVGPHAGYTYAGNTLAQTYKAWDVGAAKRVFILGPSHHVFFRGAQTTPFAVYDTPLGEVRVDRDVTDQLNKTGLFRTMDYDTDENEHSFEMHMPFIYKMSQGAVSIVPILIGHTDEEYDNKLAQALAPYFQDKSNTFVVSTDFCHWGRRFGYTAYTDDSSVRSKLKILKKHSSAVSESVPIYKSIEYLDKKGMETASSGSYEQWNEYLSHTDNTICGRTPLGIVLRTIETAKVANENGTASGHGKLKWIGYAQSSHVTDESDSSVSYASGYAVC